MRKKLKTIEQLKSEFTYEYDKKGDIHFKECSHFIMGKMKKFFGQWVDVIEKELPTILTEFLVLRIEQCVGGFPKEWFTDEIEEDFIKVEDFSL
jgi:hypothetical protein